MQAGNVIEVKNITKSFKIYYDRAKTLKDRLSILGKSSCQKREVLRGISFDVKKGEAIGLIGKNGCGKSTTLKMLTRIIYPDSGSVEIKGKVSSLLELGAGFHPDMSGIENIYLNASVFGLTKKEIDQKVGEIIEFSELKEFIDNPVRTYSSGMYMRLAFSVAINVDADVLLIDEILGVGDVSFQKKCFEKLKEIKMAGTTIVIVSHSLEQIEQICDRSIWICDGKIKEEGKPRIVNAHYYQAMETERLRQKEEFLLDNEKKAEAIEKKETNKEKKTSKAEENNIEVDKIHELPKKEETEKRKKKTEEDKISLPAFCDKMAVRTGNKKVEIIDITMLNAKDEKKVVFETDDTLKVQWKVKSHIGKTKISLSVSIWREDGLLCYGVNSYTESEKLYEVESERTFELDFEKINLLSGKYWLNVSIFSPENEEYDVIKYSKQFYVNSIFDGKEFGVYQMRHAWRI